VILLDRAAFLPNFGSSLVKVANAVNQSKRRKLLHVLLTELTQFFSPDDDCIVIKVERKKSGSKKKT